MVPGIPPRPDGPYGDYYVWSDTSQKYTDARIIFVDTEESNWTFDPVRRQFYWHRFFSHQPDLNYDNPAVQEAMIDVMRFWLGLGIDGFRLDAVPYLFEREAPTAKTCPRRTPSSSASARWWTTNFPAGCCWPRPTSGRPTSSSTSATPPPAATNATWPFTSR
ncbi:alpha amylase, catalytic domain protein [Mycobacterium kansasii]|uniref:Alpha amylase, catalytic domain protein n=1 Tax=Mycobacterium kansasii TaxID=1768 RepID=A0A1V3WDU2_MYCKA|nr:alpha amylase, catalytic domain protein [Mycobacterium kansasii]